jgi:hypothetical protein
LRFLALATSNDAYFAGLTPVESVAGSKAEATSVWELYRDGVIREISFRTDRRDVVILLDAEDIAGARAALDSLPFVAAGAVTFELVGLQPYDGWALLFAGEAGR